MTRGRFFRLYAMTSIASLLVSYFDARYSLDRRTLFEAEVPPGSSILPHPVIFPVKGAVYNRDNIRSDAYVVYHLPIRHWFPSLDPFIPFLLKVPGKISVSL
jgi:hypothetical protein